MHCSLSGVSRNRLLASAPLLGSQSGLKLASSPRQAGLLPLYYAPLVSYWIKKINKVIMEFGDYFPSISGGVLGENIHNESEQTEQHADAATCCPAPVLQPDRG